MKQKFEESLPDYEQYKNMSCIVIGPKESPKKAVKKTDSKKSMTDYYNEPKTVAKGVVLNNTLFEPNIIKNLRALYIQYSDEFSSICSTVLNQKYKIINKNIYKFCTTGFENNNGMMGSIILNTDQNRPDFFNQLLELIKRKAKKKNDPFDLENTFNYVYPKNLNDLDKLFHVLDIHDDSIIDKKCDQLKRIIIVTDIQSANHVAFNIFLQRILEYNRREFPKYNYILIFDVAYDPKTLFDKINVSLLSKIVFFTITNTPSNYLYHEILYNFIYKMNTGFYIPKSHSLKEVLNSIELHQISIESFKHYFNLILFQFFFMHQWNDDEYLIFLNELDENKIKQNFTSEIKEEKDKESAEKKNKIKKKTENESLETIIDKKRKEILENKLNEIYNGNKDLKKITKIYNILPNNVSNEVDKLLKNYKDKMNTWKIFKKFYELFEGIITNYLKDSKDHKDSVYYFLYKFLQYDSSSNFEEIIKRRARAVHKIINKIEDNIEVLRKYFYPNYKKLIKEIDPLLNDADKNLLKTITEKLDNLMKSFEQIDIRDVERTSDNFNIWVKELFKMDCFKKINESDKEQVKENCKRKFMNVYHRYLEYKYMIEPPLMHAFLIDLFEYATIIKGKKEKEKEKNNFEIKEGDFEFKNCLRAYFKCFMNLSSTFKLNHFFYDFLIEFNINTINDNNKDLIENYKKIFLVLSYWFNLVGIFQKKKGKKQIFVKNYYEKVNYFGNNK